MKYFLIAFAILIVGIFIWNNSVVTYGRLSAQAASEEGVDSATARKFFRETLISACHDDETRVKLTQLSASDCELAVKNKDFLCDVKMQMTREKTIRSEDDFKNYGMTYVECIYPDNTNYVSDRSLPTASDFKK